MDESLLTSLDLMQVQVDVLFTHDARGRMVTDNEPDGEPAPRFFLGRTRQGNIWRIRHDLPDQIAAELDHIAASEPVQADLAAPLVHIDAILAALRQDREPEVGHAGPAYRFPAEIPDFPGAVRITRETLHYLRNIVGDLERLANDFDHVEPWLSVVVADSAVSSCFSSRLSTQAAEARLDTLESFRGRGYGAAATTAWARAVREMGRVPLYGTSWDNAASQAVAHKLGLILCGSSMSVN